MKNHVQMLKTVLAVSIAACIASCGSKPSGSASGGSGAGGSSGSGPINLGGSNGDGGANGTGANGGPNGSNLGGGGFFVAPDGAVLEACVAIGQIRPCCVTGTQQCTGNEFGSWGICTDSTGVVLNCPSAGGCDSPLGCDGGGGADSGPPSPPPGPPPPPPPGPPPPPPAACTDQTVNNESEILVGYSPAAGQTVAANGQIKVWVTDENSPFIAPMEQVDNTTGAVTTPGQRNALANDGLLYEPALYFAPQSPTNGGMPYFPQWIKGSYNNNPPTRGTFTGGAAIDPIPPGARTLQYTGEFVWDVSAIGLAPGSYTAVFSVHDGDHDRGIGCIGITIQ
jgi:hypothetical protein